MSAPHGVPSPFSRAATAAARLRPMLPSDLEAVLALEHELFPEDAWSPGCSLTRSASPPRLGCNGRGARARWAQG